MHSAFSFPRTRAAKSSRCRTRCSKSPRENHASNDALLVHSVITRSTSLPFIKASRARVALAWRADPNRSGLSRVRGIHADLVNVAHLLRRAAGELRVTFAVHHGTRIMKFRRVLELCEARSRHYRASEPCFRTLHHRADATLVVNREMANSAAMNLPLVISFAVSAVSRD